MEHEQSILFTLPIELRELIYDFTFLEPVVIAPEGRALWPALLVLSKEVRREALPRFNKMAIFHCEDLGRDLPRWLRSMSGPGREATACVQYVAGYSSRDDAGGWKRVSIEELTK